MARLYLLILLASWLLHAALMWLTIVHDSTTTAQFVFLATPPTIGLLVLLFTSGRLKA